MLMMLVWTAASAALAVQFVLLWSAAFDLHVICSAGCAFRFLIFRRTGLCYASYGYHMPCTLVAFLCRPRPRLSSHILS